MNRFVQTLIFAGAVASAAGSQAREENLATGGNAHPPAVRLKLQPVSANPAAVEQAKLLLLAALLVQSARAR
jgi:hypothetical protein